jgi:hypothetical protein
VVSLIRKKGAFMKKAIPFLVLLALTLNLSLAAAAQQADDGAPEQTADDSSGTKGYFRIDTDGLSTQLWLGATHDLGAGVGLASDIYVVGAFGELDLGVSFSAGPLSLLPMVGIGFDFGEARTESLIAPQLFTILDISPIYFESWIQVFFNDIFVEGATDAFYTRNFVLFQVIDALALGPQVELTYEFNNAADDELASLPVGGRVNVNYGENNTLGLFLGYETQADDGPALAGRFTFVRLW